MGQAIAGSPTWAPTLFVLQGLSVCVTLVCLLLALLSLDLSKRAFETLFR